ncbi:conserved hypothetical protein [Gammaproteobacteria bacterium]
MKIHKMRQNLQEKLTTCPICGGEDIPAFFLARVEGYQGHLSYANCQDCGQLFLNPRLGDNQLKDYYQGDYRNRLLGPTGVTPQDETAQRLRASLQAQVANAWGVIPYNVLDVGCGSGYLLWEWEKRGAKCTGVEPDTRCHQRTPASRYKISTDISELPAEKYDLICMSHSLEHINHPKEFLEELLDKHAKKDTQLLIEVPNSECCSAAFRISHPMAFTRYTLEKLLGLVGFKLDCVFYHALSNTKLHRYLLVLASKINSE